MPSSVFVGWGVTHILAALGCGVDLWSKQRVFTWLGPPSGRVHWFWEPYFGLETSINTGALFGIGQGQVLYFAAVSVIAIAAIEYWLLAAGGGRQMWLAVAFGLILGGILGNLYDRLGLWGTHGVRDWILFRYGRFVWPNFNVADSCLVGGAAMIILHSIMQPAPRADRAASSAAESAGEAAGAARSSLG